MARLSHHRAGIQPVERCSATSTPTTGKPNGTALMAGLDAGVEAFFTALDAAHASDRAVVMTVSEFGRRPGENGSGTDHGTAAPHFFIGAGVKGGRYGAPPSLTQLDAQGNLVHSVDFRTLYATAAQGWLGVDAEAIVGKGFTPMPILA